jgi:hypothetical protein
MAINRNRGDPHGCLSPSFSLSFLLHALTQLLILNDTIRWHSFSRQRRDRRSDQYVDHADRTGRAALVHRNSLFALSIDTPRR